MPSPIANPWKIFDLFTNLIVAIGISSQIAAESFNAYSAFVGAYQCFMILEDAGKEVFSCGDLVKIYLRKYLKLAPIYYLVLFAGWNSCSMVSDDPIWLVMRELWYNCDQYLWVKLLFIGNIFGYQEATEGCMYWAWAIQCDMQLHLLVPFLVMIYTKFSNRAGDFAMLFLVCVSMVINCFIIYKYELRAGLFAIENRDILEKFYSKPWTKLYAVALGVYFAHLYI